MEGLGSSDPCLMLRGLQSLGVEWKKKKFMKTTKFIVKVRHGGIRAPEYVQRTDRTPIQTTTNRKLALIMGRFTAEDAVKSIQTSRCSPEIESVQVHA
jgi:hypothetical protein